MDTRSGQIYPEDFAKKMDPIDQKYIRPMGYDPTPEQRRTGKVGRNDPCPCGSGKKFKKCCLWRADYRGRMSDEIASEGAQP